MVTLIGWMEKTMSLADICNRDVVCVDKTESVPHAAQLMRQHHVGDLIITESTSGKTVPIGILTDRDIVIEVLAKDIEPTSVSIEDIMSRFLATADQSDTVDKVIEKMFHAGVRRIPIVNQKIGLVGIVRMEDLIQSIANQIKNITRILYIEQQHEKRLRD